MDTYPLQLVPDLHPIDLQRQERIVEATRIRDDELERNPHNKETIMSEWNAKMSEIDADYLQQWEEEWKREYVDLRRKYEDRKRQGELQRRRCYVISDLIVARKVFDKEHEVIKDLERQLAALYPNVGSVRGAEAGTTSPLPKKLAAISISPDDASSPTGLSDIAGNMPAQLASPIQHADFPLHPCWTDAVDAPLPNILASASFREFYRSKQAGLVDKDINRHVKALINAVSVPDEKSAITFRTLAALKAALAAGQDPYVPSTFKEQFPIRAYQSDVGGAMSLQLNASSWVHESDPSKYLIHLLVEHKVGNGLGDQQCTFDYLHAVSQVRKGATPEDPAYLVPVHEDKVALGFSHPVLAIIIEERNLRFEALHWGPAGVVMARLGSCDLRPTPLHLDCAILLTAARRCLESLIALNQEVKRSDWRPNTVRDPTSTICSNAVPDVGDILAVPMLEATHPAPLWEVKQVQAWTHSHIFRCYDKHELAPVPATDDDKDRREVSSGPVMLKVSTCTVPSLMKTFHQRTEEIARHWHTLYEVGLAPKLYSMTVEDIWRITVAEWLDGPWTTLEEALKRAATRDQVEVLRGAVMEAVARMHALGLAHGDLLAVNIMVKWLATGNWEVKFIDMDWICIDGQGCYPPDINIFSITRPAGVVAGGIIHCQHDLDQVSWHFDNWRPV